MADHDNNARQRKALSHGLSKKALWEQEAIVQGFMDKLMRNFHRFAEHVRLSILSNGTTLPLSM